MVFKDNPVIIMFMPIIIFIIRQIEEWWGASARIYKELFPNLASVVISNDVPYNYTYKCYTFVNWYIAKECKMDKMEATTYMNGVIHYDLDDDIISSIKFQDDTIIINAHNKDKKKIMLYSKNNNIDSLKEFIDFCFKEYTAAQCMNLSSKKTYQLLTYNINNTWTSNKINVPKTKENTFLSEEQNKIFGLVEKFINSENIYMDHGIPYKKGFLLHGLPGTGKSTTIHAVASYLQRDIYYLNLNEIKANVQLKEIFDYLTKTVVNGGIIVIEDIDAMTSVVLDRSKYSIQERQKDTELTLEYFLNVLQGTLTRDDSIFIVTTKNKRVSIFL
jgi:ATP-dependent 26S proteasome regulatory subunit